MLAYWQANNNVADYQVAYEIISSVINERMLSYGLINERSLRIPAAADFVSDCNKALN